MPLLPSSIYSVVARHPSRTILHPLAARDATVTIYKTVPGVYGNDSHGAKPGVVAGIVIGVACAFLIVICSIYCWVNREYAAEARAAAAASTDSKKKARNISSSASVMSMPAPLGLHTSTRSSAAAAAAHARSGGHLPLRGSSQRHRRSASQTRTNARKPSRLSHDSLRISSSASMSRKRSQSHHHTQSQSHASSHTIPRPFILASETSESTDSTSSDIVVQQIERQRRSLTRKPVPRRTDNLAPHRGKLDDDYGQTRNQNQSQSPDDDEDDEDSDDEVIVVEEPPKASSSRRSRLGRSRRSPSRQSEYSSISTGPEAYEAQASAGGRRRRSRG